MKTFTQLRKNFKNDFSKLKSIKVAILGDTATQFLSQALAGTAYDVGGVKEIVNRHTGILLPKNLNIEDAVNKLNNFQSEGFNSPDFRKGVKQFLENNFKDSVNYPKFYSSIADF